jgi:hypothetical protein
MARRTKQTDGRVAAILASLEMGNTHRAAAAQGDINVATFYDWLNRDPTFHDAVEKAEANAEALYLGRVKVAADNGTWQAAAWWLERRKPDDFGQRARVDLTTVRDEAGLLASKIGIDDTVGLVERADELARGRL